MFATPYLYVWLVGNFLVWLVGQMAPNKPKEGESSVAYNVVGVILFIMSVVTCGACLICTFTDTKESS